MPSSLPPYNYRSPSHLLPVTSSHLKSKYSLDTTLPLCYNLYIIIQPPTKEPLILLKQLKSNHHEIARLSFSGLKPQEIAVRLEMNAQSVYAIQRDPLYQAFISGLNAKANNNIINVRQRLAELNGDALDTLEHLLTEDKISPSVQLGAVNSVLDRTGYKAPEVINHNHTHLTMDDITALAKRAKAIDNTIDITSEVEAL